MPLIREQNQSYRRGLVLGLTMAEVVVLLIFVLLLVLGGLFARQAMEVEQTRQRLTLLQGARAELARISAELGRDPQTVIQELAKAEEVRRRLVLVEQEADQLREFKEALEAERPADMPDRPLPELFRELVLIRDAIVEAEMPPEPTKLAEELASAADAQRALDVFKDQGVAGVAKENERLLREARNLKAQNASLRQQIGPGLDHPPCWATPEGKAEYIFDVALTGGGLILRERHLPHRVADREELPLSGIVLEQQLTPRRFLAMTKSLYEWSVEKECRFVVRAFDLTEPSDKDGYKRHMNALEGRFYKYEERRESFPVTSLQ